MAGILQNMYGGRFVKVSAFNSAVTTTEEDFWDQGALWTPPTSAFTYEIASTSTNADTAAGVGARTVQVVGLASDYTLQAETSTMNGRTAVAGTKSFIRIYGHEVVSAGTNGRNTGAIAVANSATGWTSGAPSTAAHINGQMAATENVSHNGWFTAPAGRSYQLRKLLFGAMTQSARLHLYVRPFGGLWYCWAKIPMGATGSLSWEFGGTEVLELTPKMDFKMGVYGAAASAVVGAIAIFEKTGGSDQAWK
jgi:hypothetical protein